MDPHRPNEKKQEAKYTYLRHVEEHGCDRFDVVISRGRSEKRSNGSTKRGEGARRISEDSGESRSDSAISALQEEFGFVKEKPPERE